MLIDISQLQFTKEVHGVIHIGAHECEERLEYLSRFHNVTDNEIIWIDALKTKVDSIKIQHPTIRIFNECISNKDNEDVTFHVTNNIQSSSFLNLKEHLIVHPDIYEIEQIEMKTKTLKTFYEEHNFTHNQFNFMALDIQGTDLLALKGAGDILNSVDYIYIEVTVIELYENCALLNDVDDYLSKFNFSRQTISMTQCGWGDAFYVKNIFDISKNFTIEYGIEGKKIDITDIVMKNVSINNYSEIPAIDEMRAILYGDPIFGTRKFIFITCADGKYLKFSENEGIVIDITNHKILTSINPDVLTVYKSPYNKIRLGKEYDGGYIVCDIPNIKYDFFISGGILDDISFEEDFCNKYNDVKCNAYDGYIDNIYIKNKNISFIKKYIGNVTENNFTNLHDIINNFNNIFVKMDIEGSEIEWLKSLSENQIDKFAQIVMEFHNPFCAKEIIAFEKLNRNHVLVHFHANNCCGVRNHKGVNIPNVFECTYIHKKYYTEPYKLNNEIIPGLLDMKNVLDKDEIIIDYKPFVN